MAVVKKWNNIMELVEKNEIDKIVGIYRKMEEKEDIVFKHKLISEMKQTKNRRHRNTIATVLGDLKCNEAISAMIELINKPENRMCVGSLIYALQELDCEHEIKNIIHVLFDGNYEAQYNTYSLLEQKVSNMDQEDKYACITLVKQERQRLQEKLDFITDIEEMLE